MTTISHTSQFARDEALFLENDGPWIEQCDDCGENFRTVTASYWCDDCYDRMVREERGERSSRCYYCNGEVAPADDIGGDFPTHSACAAAMFGDAP